MRLQVKANKQVDLFKPLQSLTGEEERIIRNENIDCAYVHHHYEDVSNGLLLCVANEKNDVLYCIPAKKKCAFLMFFFDRGHTSLNYLFC